MSLIQKKADGINKQTAAGHCWACGGQVSVTDGYCRRCGVSVATNSIAHERLIAIEKRLQHALIGVALWLFVIFPLIGGLVL